MNEPYEGQVRWFVVEFPGGMTGEPVLQQYHNGDWVPISYRTYKIPKEEQNEDS